MPRTPGVQNKVFFSSGTGVGVTFPRGTEWELPGCQECSAFSGPFQTSPERRSWLASRSQGASQEDCRSHPPVLLCILFPHFFPPISSCLPGKAEMQRRGPAIIFLEEAAEGQLPDSPMRGHPVSSSWALVVCLDLAVGECGIKGDTRIRDWTC